MDWLYLHQFLQQHFIDKHIADITKQIHFTSNCATLNMKHTNE